MKNLKWWKVLLSSTVMLTLAGCTSETEPAESEESAAETSEVVESEASVSESEQAMVEVEWAETEAVAAAIGAEDYVFVDTRNDSYFNGYTDPNQTVNGHIAGAVQYTAEWVGSVNPDKLEKYVSDKGITADKNIIVYDSEEARGRSPC